MVQPDYNRQFGPHGTPENRAMQNQPTATVSAEEEELLGDVDEPPDLERTPRPSGLKLHESFKASFSKTAPSHCERRESLLTNALHSNNNSPIEEHANTCGLRRGLSCASTWSNNSISTAELTSDGGFTSPATRTSTPSPPPPASMFHRMTPVFKHKSFEQPVSIVRHDDDYVSLSQKESASTAGEHKVEASLGRKRCISFACGGRKESAKPPAEASKPSPKPEQIPESPKRVPTIKFACPSKVSFDAPSKDNKPRTGRAVSPAPPTYRSRASPKGTPRAHHESDSTVRNTSPITFRKATPAKDRSRRLSTNSDLARCEAFRFHEFASSEEEVDEWLQESTCHRSRLTINDTLRIENNLRQLGEEAEEEALDEDEDEDDEDDGDEEVDEDDEDDEDEDDDNDNDDDYADDAEEDISSDEGFQTDDENGFAGSDDESDAGSDFHWWAPGARSTAATSMENIEHVRPISHCSVSESSVGSVESGHRFRMPDRPLRRRKPRPVNIRVPSPELPDSTDFVCGTLDEDRPLEAAYLSCLERRRAAKHKITPQDIDPTFPTSDPEMDEEDEDDEPMNMAASESDQHLMMHGQMDPVDGDSRGRSKLALMKRSPLSSPKRLRSPPPTKRTVHRSPPPRKLFGGSPRRVRSPALGARLQSPPPIRRASNVVSPLPQRAALSIRFAGLAERPALTISSSLPRTPITSHPEEYDDDDATTCGEPPVRRAIAIKIGLEKKRQRRKDQLYKKMHRKGSKDKRPPPGKGAERMREMGLGLAAHKGKARGFAFGMPPTPDQKDIHVLSV